MRVDDATRIEIAVKSILVLRARIIGDLDSVCVSGRVVIDVQVGCLVEAMQDGAHCRWSEVVVDVGIAG